MAIVIVLLFLLLILGAIFTAYASLIGAPFLPTPKHIIKEILKEANLKSGEKLYDLGSGTGQVLVIAEKFFGANTVGFELSPIFYLISKLNLFFNNTRSSQVFLKNFYNQNISDADVVFAYLIPRSMNKLELKFIRELKKGTRIISYAFAIKNWEPKKILKKERMPPVFIYEIS
ncbi:MAG: 50S ribosomal protein L11 methyltransferase [Candidatus Azambacteria bacterium]|nr:50S ribosomal protein L11 methyltransferase [Candidatus Azambacteria bacterium]